MTASYIGIRAFLLLAILFPGISHAGSLPRYIWSDSKGFIVADAKCQVKNINHIPFFISQKPSSQLNATSELKALGYGGIGPTSLLDRSLVSAKGVSKPIDGSIVRVISVPRNAHAPNNTQNISKTGDEGFLANESLQDLSNFVIEVINEPWMPKGIEIKAPFKIQKSYWQATFKDEKFISLVCADLTKPINYFLFDVYESASLEPITQVGVNIEDTKILNAINVYNPDEANQVIGGEDYPLPKLPAVSSTNGVGSKTKIPTKASPMPAKNPSTISGVPVVNGDLIYVLCTKQKAIAVLNKDLKTSIFPGHPFDIIIPSQLWDENKKADHVEVQFPNRNDSLKTGWIPRGFVKLKSECAPLKLIPSKENNLLENSPPKLNTPLANDTQSVCCHFPTIKRPSEDYTAGILQFRAKRERRRLHAGNDLYRSNGEPVVAVAAGTIIRGYYYFYQGVFAIEVKHPKFIARYGEVLGLPPRGITKDKHVVAGQAIGYIGKVNSGCCAPMLHFEMYKGVSQGTLTRYRFPPFDRRSDVMDPTNYLRQWEKKQFGSSY